MRMGSESYLKFISDPTPLSIILLVIEFLAWFLPMLLFEEILAWYLTIC